MSVGVIIDVILAVFAVFGLYALARLILTAVFFPKELFVAVELSTPEDAARAPLYIARAREGFFARGRVAALLSPPLAGDAALLAFLESENIPYYITQKGKE